MNAAEVGRVPIVEPATRKLVGSVSRKDLLRFRADTGSLEHERQAFFIRAERAGTA